MLGVIKVISEKMTFCKIEKFQKLKNDFLQNSKNLKFSSAWSYSSHSFTKFPRVLGVIATYDLGGIATPHPGVITIPLLYHFE